MLDRAVKWLILLSALVVVGGGLLVWFGAFNGGGGEGSLEKTDFNALVYPADDPNTSYLVCSAVVCSQALPAVRGPVFDVSSQALIRAISAIADEDPFVRRYEIDLAGLQLEFIERLPSKTVPAVVSIRLRELDFSQTEVNIYSYQPLGKSEAGEHQVRVDRWIDRLANRLGEPVR